MKIFIFLFIYLLGATPGRSAAQPRTPHAAPLRKTNQELRYRGADDAARRITTM